jgi:O-antigen/teichoic acid export membrane protein
MSKFRASFNNLLFGSLNNITLIVIGVVMVPYYLSFFSVATYGAWLASGGIISLIASLEAGIPFILIQKLSVSYGKNDIKNFRIDAGSGIALILIIAIAFGILVFSIRTLLPEWVHCPEADIENLGFAILLVAVSGFLGLLQATIRAFFQVWQETIIPNLVQNIAHLIGLVTIIVFLNLNWGVAAIAMGSLVREVFNFSLITFFTSRSWKKKKIGKLIISKTHIYGLVKEISFPFIGRISHTVLTQSHTFVLAALLSPEITAIYSFTSKVAMLSKHFVTIYTNGLFGSINIARAEKSFKEFKISIEKALTIFFFFLIISLGFSFVFSYDIVRYWVGADKFGGEILLLLIVLYCFMIELFQFQNNLILAEGEFNLSTGFQLIYAVMYIVLTVAFIDLFKFGVLGLPLSLLSAAFVVFIISNQYFLKKYTINIYKLSIPGMKLILISFMVIIPSKIFTLYNRQMGIFMLMFAMILFFIIILTSTIASNKFLKKFIASKVLSTYNRFVN